MTFMDDENEYDYCDVCAISGDDYSFDNNGELNWNCPDCPWNPDREDGR